MKLGGDRKETNSCVPVVILAIAFARNCLRIVSEEIWLSAATQID
jgi:hypothetical protein